MGHQRRFEVAAGTSALPLIPDVLRPAANDVSATTGLVHRGKKGSPIQSPRRRAREAWVVRQAQVHWRFSS